MFRPARTARSRSALTSMGAARSASARSHAFLLGALLTAGSGCGQDVLVARWTLLSESPDAAASEDPDGADAGVNEQALHAERARERARMRANPPSDSDSHSSNEKKE